MGPRKKISADGTIINEGEGAPHGTRPLPPLSSARFFDVFGFNLQIREFVVVLALTTLMLGPNGTLAFLIILGAYTVFQRVAAGSSGNNGTGVDSSGGGRVWGGNGGANIRGLNDLPKPLPRG